MDAHPFQLPLLPRGPSQLPLPVSIPIIALLVSDVYSHPLPHIDPHRGSQECQQLLVSSVALGCPNQTRLLTAMLTDCTWSVGLTIQDPVLFRGALMLAAMHYSWMTGSVKDIEQTYLHHKVETLRAINTAIADPITSETCVNSIAALALSEVRTIMPKRRNRAVLQVPIWYFFSASISSLPTCILLTHLSLDISEWYG